MPSQEDYLDELLKTMDEDSEKKEALGEEQEIPNIDTLSELSEDEIMQLLAGNGDTVPGTDMPEDAEVEPDVQEWAEMESGMPEDAEGKPDMPESIGLGDEVFENAGMAVPEDAIPSEIDLLSEMDGAEADDLREIRELLQKADRNEPIVEEEPEEESEGGEFSFWGENDKKNSIAEEEDERAGEQETEALADLSVEQELEELLGTAGQEKTKEREAARKERAERREAVRKERAERRETAKKERAERREAVRRERAEKQEAAKRMKAEKQAAAKKKNTAESDKDIDIASLDAILAEAGELGGEDGLNALSGQEGADGLNALSGLEGADGLSSLSGLEGADDLSGLNGLGSTDDLSGLSGLESADELGGEATDTASDAYDTDFDLENLFQDGKESELSGLMDADADADAVEAAVGAANSKPKRGVFRKIVEFLTEEDEEEGNEEIRLSDENREILRDLDKEGKAGKKKRKSKKGSKQGGEEEEGNSKTAKKAKKAPKASREKKPKQEKKAKRAKENVREGLALPVPEKKLSFKRVLPILLLGASVGVLLFVFANASADYTDKKEAREAFYDGDYRTCYQNLYGKELNESETVMYAKSESILYIRLWLREYEMFADEGDELRALDSLIQTVDDYPVLYAYAVQWNADREVEEGYAQILGILLDKYGLTEEQARQIADEPKDKEYTRMVTAVVQGRGLGAGGESGAENGSWTGENSPAGDGSLRDELPEETELGQEIFIDPR